MVHMCPHNLPDTKDCPWCKRKGDKTFPVKKPFQLYQPLWDNFLRSFADQCHGPLSFSFSVQDMNGQVYVAMGGHADDIEGLHEHSKKVLIDANREGDNVTSTN